MYSPVITCPVNNTYMYIWFCDNTCTCTNDLVIMYILIDLMICVIMYAVALHCNYLLYVTGCGLFEEEELPIQRRYTPQAKREGKMGSG